MGQAIPRQHPSVVLRSHFKLVRALLAIAMVAVIALAATVVIVSTDDNNNQATPAAKAASVTQSQPQTAPGTRFDGGPDEGTRGPQSYYASPAYRSSYQPAPSEGFKARSGGPRFIPVGPAGR